MRGFICDRCGKTEEGKPSLKLGEAQIGETGDPVVLSLDMPVPRLDFCTPCKREITLAILEGERNIT